MAYIQILPGYIRIITTRKRGEIQGRKYRKKRNYKKRKKENEENGSTIFNPPGIRQFQVAADSIKWI